MKIPSRSTKKLHRVADNVYADWELIPHTKYNQWQKIAYTTNGIVTPGNLITLCGSALVLLGLFYYTHDDRFIGVLAFGFGRLADVLDGNVSEFTKTKSVLGASIDASADWIQLVITLVVLTLHGSMPLLAIALIGVPKIIDTASAIAAKIRKVRINVTGESKLGAAFLWSAIGLFMIESSLRSTDHHVTVLLVGVLAWLGVIIGTLFRINSVIYYARLGFGYPTDKIQSN